MKKKINDQSWNAFLELCTKINSAEALKKFFELFLTHEEKELLKSRYLIVKALLDGQLTQREIANTYKVSISQITRGSNALKMIDEDLENFLNINIKQ